MMSIQGNGETNGLLIITVENESFKAPENLQRDIETLDRAYTDIAITYRKINGHFGSDLTNDPSN